MKKQKTYIMIKELQKTFDHIEKISNFLELKIVSSQNQLDIKENIHEINLDLEKLKNNTSKALLDTSDKKDQLNLLIANLNISLVDLLSNIENLHETLVAITKKYSIFLENDK